MGRALSGPSLRLLASAGPGEGRGHLARALALAEAAQEEQIPCAISLVRGEPSAAERRRAGACASSFVSAGRRRVAGELLVVDLPDPNEVSPDELARATVFDDRETLAAAARIVVQPSQATWNPGPGAAATEILAGYEMAPLGRRILATRDAVRAQAASGPPGTIRDEGVLVCFGGSDPADVAGRIVPALEAAGIRHTTVVGPDYRGRLVPDGRSIVREPDDLAALLARVPLALLGAGTMKFEAAALGVPAVLLAVAADQLPVGPPYAATGVAIWMGDGRSVDPMGLVREIAALLDDVGRRAALAARGPRVVPGDGGRRIVQATVARAEERTR